MPSEENLVHWDAVFYQEIKNTGYVYNGLGPSNMAFFPFFPYIWKLTGFSAIAISVFNMLLFNCSLCFLINRSKLDAIFILSVISLPCFIFFYLPYSEGIFFFFGALLIYGYRKTSEWFLIIGILGCCLTRAVSTVFVPILIVTELFYWSSSNSKFNYKVIKHCLVAGLAILIIVIIQGVQTGKWFFYLEAAKNFNRKLTMPSVPFTTISPEKILGTDGVAWFIGATAIYFCSKWGLLTLQKMFTEKKSTCQNIPDKSVYFSALFISSIFLIDTFFTNKLDGQTNLWSINRHLLCTPFAICFIIWFYKDYTKERFDLCFLVFLLIVSLFVTGIFRYPIHIYFYLVISAAFIISKFFKKAKLFLYPLYAFNLILLVIYYQDYLLFKWVG